MITLSRLKELLSYNPKTGLFTRLVSKRVSKIGTIAGAQDSYGYTQIKLDGKLYLAHRLAWMYMLGVYPSKEIDHINFMRNDNRWCNLREATRCQNAQHIQRKLPKSGVRGAYRDHNAWHSFVHANGVRAYLGSYKTKEEAGEAYKDAARNLHKDFSHTL